MVNSPPRTGNIFLTGLLRDYKMYKNESGFSPIMVDHNHRLLSVNHPEIINIMIIRNPIDIVKSTCFFQKGFNKDKDDIRKNTPYGLQIDGTNTILNAFYESFFMSNNNYAIRFEDLKNNSLKVLGSILSVAELEYDKSYNFDIDILSNEDSKSNNLYLSSFPRNIKNNIEYIEMCKKIDAYTSKIENILKNYNKFVKTVEDKGKFLI